jgi:hypothetical protein
VAHLPLQVADVTRYGQLYTLQNTDTALNYAVPLEHPTGPPPTREFIDLQWASELWFDHPTRQRQFELAQSIAQGKCEAVSDGSFCPNTNKGTAAWCMSPNHTDHSTISAGLAVPGPKKSQSSYRSELAGVYAIIKAVRLLVQKYRLTRGSVQIGCDNISVLKRVFVNLKPASVRDDCWDLLTLVQHELSLIPQIFWNWRHIYGHQDKGKSFEELDFWSQRNVMMDERAGFCWNANLIHEIRLQDAHTTWELKVQNTAVASSFHTTLRRATTGLIGRTYWENKGQKIGAARAEAVEWPVMGKAMKQLPIHRRHWITKHHTGFCSVGKAMLQRKEWTHARCPRCGHEPETTEHLWTCKTPETNTLWNKFVLDFYQWLKDQHTHQELADVLITRLHQWRQGVASTPLQCEYPGLSQATRQQDIMGWSAAFEGRWGTLWAPVQDSYYKWLGSRKSGRRWLTAMIGRIWKVAWDLWEHRNGVHQIQQLQDRHEANIPLIQHEFNTGWYALSRRDYHLFRRSIQVLLVLHPDKQDAWLRRVTGARRRARYIAACRTLRAQQAFLRIWIQAPPG